MKECKGCKKEVNEINEFGVCRSCHEEATKVAKDLFEKVFGEKANIESVPFDLKREELEEMNKRVADKLDNILEELEAKANSDKKYAFACILDDMFMTYMKKNKDYGDSFGKQYEKYGLQSSIIRLSDKLNRIEMLSKNEAEVKDEAIEDTLLDMANYAIMTIVELKIRGNK